MIGIGDVPLSKSWWDWAGRTKDSVPYGPHCSENRAGKDDGVSPSAAPAHVDGVEVLPPTYVDVGGLDIFRGEDIKYVSRMAAVDISTEFHLYLGVLHGFDALAPDIDVTKKAFVDRFKTITSF